MIEPPVVIGIDVGTQGARVVAHDERGTLVASASERFAGELSAVEQDPEAWWSAVAACLRGLVADLGARSVAGISVTSTSGSVLPLDQNWRPLAPALMYGDRRAQSVADEVAAAFPALGSNVSWGFPKIVWFERANPQLADSIHAWRHPADFLIGRLTGNWESTDQTTALKSGFDLITNQWPAELFDAFGVDLARMPRVGLSGSIAGQVDAAAAHLTELPASTPVLLGMTDGCASQVASGAVRPGSWNSTIGTTLVIKGTTVEPIIDPLGRLYNHRHPQGYWMPGAASNTGAAWIPAWFPDQDLDRLDRLAATVIPTGELTYPMLGIGERFPFIAPTATGFGFDSAVPIVRYAAALEGVAYLERIAFDLVESLSGERVSEISTAGGGSAGETWLRIRANVLDRPIRRVRNANAATGAAIVAASNLMHSGLIDAAEAMVSTELIVEPDQLNQAYADDFARFREELVKRGYLTVE